MKKAFDWDNWVECEGPRYPHEKVIQFTFRNFPRGQAKCFRFLDLGCGNGVNSFFLLREKYDAYGTDISKSGIGFLGKAGLRGHFKVASLEAIPFRDGFFHGLICVGVLEVVPRPIATAGIREAYRVMARGGKGMFLFAAKGDYRGKKRPDVITPWTRDEVKKAFAHSGFSSFTVDLYSTTYENGRTVQKDWIITVKK